MKPLAGKIALVAGATRGAGRGIAVELGLAGATVYVTDRTHGLVVGPRASPIRLYGRFANDWLVAL